jgi:hypothetical protein
MGLIHPAYLEGLSDGEDEVAEVRPQERENSRGKLSNLYSETTLGGVTGRAKCLAFLAGTGVGVLAVSLVALLGTTKQESQKPVLAPIFAQASPVADVMTVSTRLENEVALLKRIVSGLVDTVQKLSQARRGEELGVGVAESFPFPVQVTADKAHLRKGADRSSPSILEVSRNTTLMAFNGTDKWLKVSTARGEDAWISRSVVVVKRD